jgi:60 kDa SS-A/Ro ribonucleoprotein
VEEPCGGLARAPDTWEVALSARKDKKETFERLLEEGKLGGIAVLRNLRLMIAAGVSQKLIRQRLDKGVACVLPFRFVTAARSARKVEDALESAMLKGVAGLRELAGMTGLLVDVSGSMNAALSKKSETTRWDAAAGLAILLRKRPRSFPSRPSPTRACSLHPGAVLHCAMRLCSRRRTQAHT